ncbi:15138_t:CDS:2, partial [Acaulospora colombiana]
ASRLLHPQALRYCRIQIDRSICRNLKLDPIVHEAEYSHIGCPEKSFLIHGMDVMHLNKWCIKAVKTDPSNDIDSGDSLIIDLPQLVVIGSQSSGKSTLIEGLIKWDVLSMREDVSWRCNIWLDFEFGQDGEPLVVPQRRRKFGPEITEPEHVYERLVQAQAAVLHYPTVDPDDFLQPNAHLGGEGFSHNTISVEIDGPEVESLSFVDLPGQPRMMDRVKDLATKYIRKETSLILL